MRATALALIALLVLAAAAGAVTVTDRDDVATALDISKATGAHNRSTDQLVHTVDTFGNWQPSDLANDDPGPGSVCIEIWTRSRPGEAGPNYEACATPDRRGRNLVGTISRERERGGDLRIGSVRLQRPTRSRLVFRIDPDHIKRPRSYRWRAETNMFGGGCRSASGCPDYAPDRPGTAETRVAQPR